MRATTLPHLFNTKLITSCAALLLFEEGRFQLDDPIEQFIPQLANRRVLRPGTTSLDQTEPAARPITIRHLMSHSSGLSYGLLDPGTLIFNAYNERKVINPATTLAEMIDVLADLPLVFHPGTSWEYSVAIDVLARLVEVISGQRFDAFIQSRILGPLGMVDTGFVVSDRIASSPIMPEPTGRSHEAGTDAQTPAPYPGAYLRPFPRQAGGAGLVSTLPDMVALIRSLLPGGRTLLMPETIELMMTNQLPEGVWIRFPAYGEIRGRGHGLAGALILERSAFDHQDAGGELFWGGPAGTQWWIRLEECSGLIMAQRGRGLPSVCSRVQRLAYEAVKAERRSGFDRRMRAYVRSQPRHRIL